MRSIWDWIDLYNRKAGEQFALLPNATMWANNEHGIVTWQIMDGKFWIRHCSCDYKHWMPIVKEFVKGLGFTHAFTLIKRDHKAYSRLTKAQYVGDIDDWHLMMWEVQ